MANAASTRYDIAMQCCSGAIPKAKVVIATTGLVWEQKGRSGMAAICKRWSAEAVLPTFFSTSADAMWAGCPGHR